MLCLLGTLTLAQAQAPVDVLLLPLRAQGPSQGLAETLDPVLATALADRPGLAVISARDLPAILEAEETRTLLGCPDVSCATALGQAVLAPTVLVGDLGQLGTGHVLSLRWLDAEDGEILGQASVTAPRETALPEAVLRAVHQVFGAPHADWAPPRRRPPTFWTLEGLALLPLRLQAEPYDPGAGASVAAAWGGRHRGSGLHFNVVLRVEAGRLRGTSRGALGEAHYDRTFISPALALRVQVPASQGQRLRIVAGAHVGRWIERYALRRPEYEERQGVLGFFASGVDMGLWYRFSHRASALALWGGRWHRPGDGIDPVTAVAAPGSHPASLFSQHIQAGLAWHF